MAALIILNGSKSTQYPLDDEAMLIGRHPDCTIRFDSNMVSGKHARILREGDAFFLEDLGSRNGTLVNGIKIGQRVRLRDLDEVNFGHVIRSRFEATSGGQVSLHIDAEGSSTIKGELRDEGRFAHLGSQTEAKLKAVLEISDSLAGIVDPQSVLPTILETLFRIFPNADRGCILVRNEQTQEMEPRAVVQRKVSDAPAVVLSRTIVEKVLQERTGVLSEDALSDIQFQNAVSVAALAIRSVMCAPLLGLNSEPLGVICIDSQDPRCPFRSEDLDVLMLVARQVGTAHESSRLLERYLEDQKQMYRLKRQADELRQFFSPKVVETLNVDDARQLLEPRVTDVTVLFCDIRGFSRRTERSRHDLQLLLERCSQALGLMSHQILEHGGVISDFQGDAALGFWGWPMAPHDGPLPACEAALAIYREFSQAQHDSTHVLHDFQIGIGIAHGRAIAGKIGAKVQAKIGVFGPVVNLGSRLEGMTKELRVPILMDDATAQWVRRSLPSSRARCRRLARVRPYGMETPLNAYQLLPPQENYPAISDQDIVRYEEAVDAFTSGHWDQAVDLLDRLPIEDRAKDFLMTAIALDNYVAPPSWDGVYQMPNK
ncbi:MAG: FHA domain-containing protein [Pirellulaceae bacterium]|nr:FHA domain-containing protein [Pirellulaceae bacterium]